MSSIMIAMSAIRRLARGGGIVKRARRVDDRRRASSWFPRGAMVASVDDAEPLRAASEVRADAGAALDASLADSETLRGELARLLAKAAPSADADARRAGVGVDEGERDLAAEGGLGASEVDALPAASFDAAVASLCFSEMSASERSYVLRQLHRGLRPGGVLAVADEVKPARGWQRAIHALLRAPQALLGWLLAGSTSRPIPDLAGEVRAAGFEIRAEERWLVGRLAAVTAERPGSPRTPGSPR